MVDLSQADWRKASYSNGNNGCVEVATNLGGVTGVRDSKRPEGGALVVGDTAFERFVDEVKAGRFDL